MDQLIYRRERKEILKKEIERQRQLIQEEDIKFIKYQQKIDNHLKFENNNIVIDNAQLENNNLISAISLNDNNSNNILTLNEQPLEQENFNNYNSDIYESKLIELNKELNKLKLELEELRLEGDKFYVLHGEDSILIEIDEFSKLTFYLCEQSTELPTISIEKCNGSRIRIIGEMTENDQPIYELHTMLSSKSIHQLFSVKTNFETPSSLATKPSIFERVRQNTWSLGISPLRRTTSDPTIFGERFSPPKTITSFIERYNLIKSSKDTITNTNTNNNNREEQQQQNESSKDTNTNTNTNNNNNNNRSLHYNTTSGIVDPSQESGKILFTWNTKETSVYILKTQQESMELLELLGTHIDRSKKVTAKQSQNIKLFYQQKTTMYDPENEVHQTYLKELWQLLYPDSKEFQKKSPMWKEFGFQSEDPCRDFRGMGILGLLNLIHLVRYHKDWVDSVLREGRDYPMAVAGINITSLLFELFQINEESLQKPWWSSFWSSPFMTMLCSMSRETEFAFEELYFLIFKLLDHIWTEMGATYMMFPLVMKKLKSLLHEVSLLNPNSLDEVKAKFELVMISNIITPTSSSSNNNNNDTSPRKNNDSISVHK
eukprot:gene3172-3971_t